MDQAQQSPLQDTKATMSTETTVVPDRGATFTLFHNLPKELRLQIWEHALPPPRIFCFFLDPNRIQPSTTFFSDQMGTKVQTSLDKVCQESWKMLSSNLYESQLSTATGKAPKVSLAKGVFSRAQYQKEKLERYFNCSRDVLLIQRELIQAFITVEAKLELSSIRYLALSSALKGWTIDSSLWEFVGTTFPSLKTLTIMISSKHLSKNVEAPRLVEIDPKSEQNLDDEFWNTSENVAEAKRYWGNFEDIVLVQGSRSIDFRVALLVWGEE